jgi:hypothetical protein
MKRLVSLMLTIALVLSMVAPAMAYTKPLEQIMLETEYLCDQIEIFQATGRMSSDDIYGVHVDLSKVPQGTVIATVYETIYQQATVTTFTDIAPQPYEGVNGAKDKMCRFFFYFRNNDRDNPMALWGSAPDDTVIGYVYGERKSQILSAFVAGIPECLERQRLYDNPSNGGGSSPTKPAEPKETTPDPDAWAEKYLTTVFSINQTSYTVTTVNTAEPNTGEGESIVPIIKTMDVAPYIKEDRTYVPVRYLAYALGVAEDGVTWDGNARRVGISKDDTDIALVIGSPVMQVNKSPVRMDVSPEITNDRTFLPARWVAEALGAEVEWDDTTKQAIIKMPIESED